MRSTLLSATIVAVFISITEAFTHSISGNPCTQSSTLLSLLPNQGCQLAAAAAAASASKDATKEVLSSEEKLLLETPNNAARELAKRIFSLPSQILRTPQDGGSDSFPFEVIADHESDVVVYPIVGFTYVKLDNGDIRAVPSPNAKGACNIDSIHKSRTLPTYGWFSPACQLGDMHADDQSYCGNPDDGPQINEDKK
jgi:hypothetical protein